MPIVFITGASSGFGKACAETFASQGFDLIINARRLDRLQQLQNELETKYHVNVLTLAFDVRDKMEAEKQINALKSPWNIVNILINNAGLAAGRELFQDADIEDWETMIDTNIKGLLFVTKFLVQGMIERKEGHIINVSSIAGNEVYTMGNVYCASKHAVTALSKALRKDLLPFNIKVTNISPGLAETEFSIVRFKGDSVKAKSIYEGFDALSAQDIADVIYFAASRPPHVNLEEITILPTAQADSGLIYKRK